MDLSRTIFRTIEFEKFGTTTVLTGMCCTWCFSAHSNITKTLTPTLEHRYIDCLGFAGDTLHMGRLFDSARINKGGYSLEALTTQLLGTPKITMKDRFGKRRILKDGSEGKEIIVPSVVEIQRNDSMWASWVDYSVMDAELTWRLYEYLSERLRETEWAQGRHMMDFYDIYLVPFGELLTDMERNGVRIDLPYLRNIEAQARVEMDESEKTFRDWAKTHCTDCEYMNIGSDKQIQQLVLHRVKMQSEEITSCFQRNDAFKIENTTGYIEPGRDVRICSLLIVVTHKKTQSPTDTEKTSRDYDTRFGMEITTKQPLRDGQQIC